MSKQKPAAYNEDELEKLRSVAVFPQGKRLTKKTVTDRLGSSQTDHWDGRRDADVHVKAIRWGPRRDRD